MQNIHDTKMTSSVYCLLTLLSSKSIIKLPMPFCSSILSCFKHMTASRNSQQRATATINTRLILRGTEYVEETEYGKKQINFPSVSPQMSFEEIKLRSRIGTKPKVELFLCKFRSLNLRFMFS